jgi:hypothetical protein
MKRTKQKKTGQPLKKCGLVRIDPDVAKDVAIESKRNSRTVQGEVNAILRDYYASKWDAPASVTTAQGVRTQVMQTHAGKWYESPQRSSGSQV